MTLGCKDIGFRKSEFVANIPFLNILQKQGKLAKIFFLQQSFSSLLLLHNLELLNMDTKEFVFSLYLCSMK